MNMLELAAATIAVDALVLTWTFEYRRTTQLMARVLLDPLAELATGGSDTRRLRMLLTPTWVGVLCVLNYATFATAGYLAWQLWAWWGLALFVPGRLIGSIVVGSVALSVLGRGHFLRIVERHTRAESGDGVWLELVRNLEAGGVPLERLRFAQ